MTIARISHATKKLNGTCVLPASKSISNRLLIMQALSSDTINLHNLSQADDTRLMQQALKQHSEVINLQNAGTCMRLLAAYFSLKATDVVLHGNERMHQRPIAQLVNELHYLGADIDYIDQEGFPPLHIRGKQLHGGTIAPQNWMSSQFVSALMLIAPYLTNELCIELPRDMVSEPYIQLTEEWMKKCGARINRQHGCIRIEPHPYTAVNLSCEPDWSSATYAYAMVSLAAEATLILPHVNDTDTQGDKIIAAYMERFGVTTHFTPEGAVLEKTQLMLNECEYNMSHYPDMVQTLAVLFAARGIRAVFTNIAHLQHKETNRLDALSTELNKCGFSVSTTSDSLSILPVSYPVDVVPRIKTYGDHRMAMAFAPLALVFDAIEIENPEVVQKSFPDYWQQLQKLGFDIRYT
ncbi:MAG: 3-phosphoshikimate 1-carboxyvinyltransferase [Bacteroidota bacterium]